MMMLEKNSDAIAKVMADWLDRTLPGGAKKPQGAKPQGTKVQGAKARSAMHSDK